MAVSPDIFKRGMRQLGSAVTVVTTIHDGRMGGLTATSVMSLNVDPPQLLASVNNAGYTFDLIQKSRLLCVNVLSAAQIDIAKRFAGMLPINEDNRFENLDVQTLETGAPVIKGALVAFDCRVSDVIQSGSHGLCISDIHDVHFNTHTTAPLLYMDGHFTTLAEPLLN